MTPEQKAFYELGKANANLDVARDFLQLFHCDLKKYEDIVLRKQAVCRAFVPENERLCRDCKNWEIKSHNQPCKKCFDVEAHVYWEPRKEGE